MLAWCETAWKAVRNAEVLVRPPGAFRRHHVRGHTREVGLVGQCDQVEHHVDLLGEVVQFAGAAHPAA